MEVIYSSETVVTNHIPITCYSLQRSRYEQYLLKIAINIFESKNNLPLQVLADPWLPACNCFVVAFRGFVTCLASGTRLRECRTCEWSATGQGALQQGICHLSLDQSAHYHETTVITHWSSFHDRKQLFFARAWTLETNISFIKIIIICNFILYEF